MDNDICIKCQKCVKCCPANKKVKDQGYFQKFRLASYYFGFNKDEKIRSKCSSGGTCKTLIIDSLKQGVEKVLSLPRIIFRHTMIWQIRFIIL